MTTAKVSQAVRDFKAARLAEEKAEFYRERCSKVVVEMSGEEIAEYHRLTSQYERASDRKKYAD